MTDIAVATTTLEITEEIDADAAFQHSGHEAAVWRPRFGRAHQQYFTPRWLCQAAYAIAAHAFDLAGQPENRRTLNVIDPTCGSGRLLAPFKKAGHEVFGIELDDRLTTTARRALGKRNVYQGDVMAYGPVIPRRNWQVAVINPPYGLHWPIEEDGPYSRYELASSRSIESQHVVLELVTRLFAHGLLIAVLSGKFLENSPRAAAFLAKYYQIVANVALRQPFEQEYGIAVDAAFVVGVRKSEYEKKKPAPLTGPFEGDEEELAAAVNAAFDQAQHNPLLHRTFYLSPPYHGGGRPAVPQLDMALSIDTSTAPLCLTARGVTADSDWSRAWLRFFSRIPVQAYDVAQGAYTPLGEAYGSLPNILMSGVEESRDRLAGLGFDVSLSEHDAQQIERRAQRYERDRLPVRELQPIEYLAYYRDGPIMAKATVTLPDGIIVPEGATYDLRVRWYRNDEVVKSEDKGQGSKTYTMRTHVDRGYLVLRFRPLEGARGDVALTGFDIAEIDADAIKALTEAFGLPEVKTVDDLPDLHAWATRLARFMDAHQEAAGGKRLYPVQALDVARMATKSSIALLYEMGGGKTPTIAHWATLRSYRAALIVTPASVAPGIIEDLTKWGFRAQRLHHGIVSTLVEQKRRHKLARERVKAAFRRAARLQSQLTELIELAPETLSERSREWGLGSAGRTQRELEQIVQERIRWLKVRWQEERQILAHEDLRLRKEKALARKRRHLRNLLDIQRKGKARDPEGIEAEIADTARRLEEIAGQVAQAYEALGDHWERPQLAPDFYVTSYEDLSLGDHLGLFDPWDHEHFDRKTGEYRGVVENIRTSKCSCGSPRKKALPACPRCDKSWRGENAGGGRTCRHCGHVAWTMGRSPRRMLPEAAKGSSDQAKAVRRERIEVLRDLRMAARAGGQVGESVFDSTYHVWPLGNRIQKLFPCVILDEAQDAKSKLSLRGAASRGLRARGKAILTGTWIKGYCVDLFWTAGWLLGFGSPLWPFPYRGGSGRFLEQFGTFQYITREFADTLEVGKRKLIPSVSNLGRLWKLLSPVSVRRLKVDFLQNLPPKHRHVHWLEPSGQHEQLVGHVASEMTDILRREMLKADPSMGRISMALWWGRYVASCPNKYGALHYAGAWGHKINVTEAEPARRRAVLEEMRRAGAIIDVPYSFCKVQKALALIREIQAAGEKVIVFTSLRGLYRTLEQAFVDKCISFVGIDGVSTRKRNAKVREFEASSATVLLAGTGTLNRGVTVNGANHVLILNLEWSPETTLQAEDRCHRPGQTREVHVHYILCAGTVDDQMWDLVEQKAAAQRAVQDREAQCKSVEEILAEAALANAKLAVAKAMIEQCFRRKGVSIEEAQEQAAAVVEEMATQLVFGMTAPRQKRRRRRKREQPVAVRYIGTLFDLAKDAGGNGQDSGKAPPAEPERPVQLTMFPL